MSLNTEEIHSYSRDEMMTFRELVASRTRPPFLSTEFDNGHGMFSPDLWLQNIWETEGIVVKNDMKKKRPLAVNNTIAANAVGRSDDSTILSPQRRAFSSGCKAPTILVDDKSVKPNKWRGQTQRSSATEFKPEFIRGQNAKHWTTEMSGRKNEVSRFKNMRSRNGKDLDFVDEEMPEWLDDGPSSMNDMVELKGFEDDLGTVGPSPGDQNVGRRMSANEAINLFTKNNQGQATEVNNSEKRKGSRVRRRTGSNCSQTDKSRSATQTPSLSDTDKRNDSRNSSGRASKNGGDKKEKVATEMNEETNHGKSFDVMAALKVTSATNADTYEDNNNIMKTDNEDIDNLLTKLPSSDSEFAAMLGIPLDQLNTLSPENQNQYSEPSSSRLSQFFTSSKQTQSIADSSSFPEHHTTVNDSNNNDDTVALSMMGRVMTESGKAKYEGAITELCPKVRAIVGQGPAGLHPFNLPANMSSEISNMKSSASLPPPPPILQKLFSTGVSSTEHTSSHSGPGNTTSDSSPFAREIERPLLGSGPSMDDTTAMHGIGRNFQQMNVGGADRQFISPTASMADSSNKFLSEMFSSMRTAPNLSRDDRQMFDPRKNPMFHPSQMGSNFAHSQPRGPMPHGFNDPGLMHPRPGDNIELLRAQFNHQLLMRARLILPNQNHPIDFPVLRAAFFQMMQDPAMRDLWMSFGGFGSGPLPHRHGRGAFPPPPPPHHLFPHNLSPAFNQPPPPFVHPHNHNNNRPPPYTGNSKQQQHGLPPLILPHGQPSLDSSSISRHVPPLPPTNSSSSTFSTNTGNRSSHSAMMPTSVMRRQITKVPILGAPNPGSEDYERAPQSSKQFLNQLFASSSSSSETVKLPSQF